ncbi:MAG: precorrin-3B C(17)-methyltransferase [Clostridium sp.]|nr:precorrin-3B C(17)-methyltransferase [Clostridium sp.]
MNRLYVVGMGPGGYEKMTMEAQTVLAGCEVIAGYTVYVELLKDKFPDKQYIVTGMKKEAERCRLAFRSALEGKTTAMVCSGDAGIYGMAGILLEMGESCPQVEISVVAGVTAAVSGAAVLGAPLGHDFAVISLSDLLTPWDRIELRLRCAAMSDMAICLYNPSSHKRRDYLQRACRIILEYQSPDTVCGFVRNIGRNGEHYELMTLDHLQQVQVDMFTTVFIGNSQTRQIGGRLVTPRGYGTLPSIEDEE